MANSFYIQSNLVRAASSYLANTLSRSLVEDGRVWAESVRVGEANRTRARRSVQQGIGAIPGLNYVGMAYDAVFEEFRYLPIIQFQNPAVRPPTLTEPSSDSSRTPPTARSTAAPTGLPPHAGRTLSRGPAILFP